MCDGVDNDCDGTIDSPTADASCQQPHTFTVCGNGSCQVTGCGFLCDLVGANETCEHNYCEFLLCQDGFADCDARPWNGCESDLHFVPNTCENAFYNGGRCGDTMCGPFCAPAGNQVFLGIGARGGQWVHASILECACGAGPVATSNAGPGETETITLSKGDDPDRNDSFDFWIEVRYVSGTSCIGWDLTLEATNC